MTEVERPKPKKDGKIRHVEPQTDASENGSATEDCPEPASSADKVENGSKPVVFSSEFGETSTDHLETERSANNLRHDADNGTVDSTETESLGSSKPSTAVVPDADVAVKNDVAEAIPDSDLVQCDSSPITTVIGIENETETDPPKQEVEDEAPNEVSEAAVVDTSDSLCLAFSSRNAALESLDELQLECTRMFLLRGTGTERDALGDLLGRFLNAITLVLDSRSRVEQHATTCASRADAVWTFNRQTIQLEGVCIDSARVSRRVDFETAQFDESALRYLADVLAAARNELFGAFVSAAVDALTARAAIDIYIDELFTLCPLLRTLPDSLNVRVLAASEIGDELRAELNVMLRAVSSLMAFLRRPRLRSTSEVYSEAKRWLLRLCATLLRAGAIRDHLVLLIELAHLPGGMVADWASGLFQPLVDPYVVASASADCNGARPLNYDQQIEFCVAAFSLLCRPFPDRERLLKLDESGVDTASTSNENAVASDVDPVLLRSVLAEEDLFALLCQMPVYDLLKRILGVQLIDERESYEPTAEDTETICHRLLQAFAVTSDLFAAIHSGMRLYSSVGYRRACDQLGKVALLSIRTLTRHWLVCRAAIAGASQPDRSQRGVSMQIEFERQFRLVVSALSRSRKLVGWKRLRKLPFAVVSRSSSDLLVRLLLEIEPEEANLDQEFVRRQLSELTRCALDFSATDVRFCLATFASVLVARCAPCAACVSHNVAAEASVGKDDLVEQITVGILEAAFQLSRDLQPTQVDSLGAALVNAFAPLAEKYPSLLSVAFSRLYSAVMRLEKEGEDGEMTVEDGETEGFESVSVRREAQVELLERFTRDAPWHFWQVNVDELRQVENWLLAPLGTLRQRLVQLILERINLEEAEDSDSERVYFLPREVHRHLCSLVLRIASHHLGVALAQETAAFGGSSAAVSAVRWVLQSNYQLLAAATQQALCNLVTFLHRQKYSQYALAQQFSFFLWTVLLRVKLHRSLLRFFKVTIDAACDSQVDQIEYEMEVQRDVPELREPIDMTPFHAYAKLMLGGAAITVDRFTSVGLDSVQQLLDANCHLPVLHALFIIVSHYNSDEESPASTPTAESGGVAAVNCGKLEALLGSSRFQAQMVTLANADQVLWSYYRDMLKIQQTQFPGPIVSLWSSMMRSQLLALVQNGDAAALQLAKPQLTRLIGFWTRLFVSLNAANCEWFSNKPIVFLLNSLAELTFHLRLDHIMLDILYAEYTRYLVEHQRREANKGSPKNAGGLIGVLQWFSRSSTPSNKAWPSFLDPLVKLGCRTDEYAFVIRLYILVTTRYEDETNIWSRFELELASLPESSGSPTRADLNVLLAKVLSSLQLQPSSLTVDRLAVFRWIEYLLGHFAHDHPLYPAFWLHLFGRFFQLRRAHSVFHTVQYSTALQKSLRRLLECARDLFADRGRALIAAELADAECERALQLGRLFGALVFWADEPRLLELQTEEDYGMLPDVYFPKLLARVRCASFVDSSSNGSLSFEYADSESCVNDARRDAERWNSLSTRMRAVNQDGPASANELPAEGPAIDRPASCCVSLDTILAAVRLIEALSKTHKRYRRPPALSNDTERATGACFSSAETSMLADLQRLIDDGDSNVLVTLVERALETLAGQARAYLNSAAASRTRDEAYVRELRSLYRNEQLSQRFALTCRTTCRGPAIVTQPIATKVRQDAVGVTIDENRACANRFRRQLLDCLATRAENEASSNGDSQRDLNVHVICAKTLLVEKLVDRLTESAAVEFVQQVGTQLFYRFLKLLADDGELGAFSPTQQFIDRVVSTLGSHFISTNEREASTLLRSILDCANDVSSAGDSAAKKRKDETEAAAQRSRLKLEICSRLAPYFVPSFNSPSFLALFKQVNALDVDQLGCPVEILFVLLTKFELRSWLALELHLVPVQDRLDALRCVIDAIRNCGGLQIHESRRTVFDLHARHFQALLSSICGLDATLALRTVFDELARRSLPPICFESFCAELRAALTNSEGHCVLSAASIEQLLSWIADYFVTLRLALHSSSSADRSSSHSSSPSDAAASANTNTNTSANPRVCSNNQFLLLLEPLLDSLMNLLRFLFEQLWCMTSAALREQQVGMFDGVGRYWSLLERAFKPFLAPLSVPLDAADAAVLRRSSADLASHAHRGSLPSQCQLPLLVIGVSSSEDANADRKKRKDASVANGNAAQSSLLLERYAFILGHFRSVIELLIHDVVGFSLSDAKAIGLDQSAVANTLHQLTQLTWAHYLTFSNDMHSLLRSLAAGSSSTATAIPHSASAGDVSALAGAAGCVLPTMNALFNLYHSHFLARFNWEVMRVDLTNLRCLIVFHETWSANPPVGVNPAEYAALSGSVLRFACRFVLKWSWLAFFRDLIRDASRRAVSAADVDDCDELQRSAMRAQLVDSAMQLLVAYTCSSAQLSTEKESTALLEIFLKFTADCAPLVDAHAYRALLAAYIAALKRSAATVHVNTRGQSDADRSLLYASVCDRLAARTRVALALRAAAGFEQLRRSRPSADSMLVDFAVSSVALDKCALFVRMHCDALNAQEAVQYVASLCSAAQSRDAKTSSSQSIVVRDCQAYVRQVFADLELCVPSIGFAQLAFDEKSSVSTAGRKACHAHVLDLAQILVDCVANSHFASQLNGVTQTTGVGVSPTFLITTVFDCIAECNSCELLVGLIHCGARSLASDASIAERSRRFVLYHLLETAFTRYFNLTYEVDSAAFRRLVSHLNVARSVPAIVDELLAANSLLVLYCLVYGAFLQELIQKNDSRRALSCLLDLLSGKLRVKNEMDERRLLLFWFQVIYTLIQEVGSYEATGSSETVQPACADLLNAFCAVLLNTEENNASRGGWFSSAKENAKKNVLSTRFRIVLRSLYTFIVAQMPAEQSVRVRVCNRRSSSATSLASTGSGANANSQAQGQGQGQGLAQPTRFAAALRQFETMRDSRQNAAYREVLQDVLARVQDRQFTFLQTGEFLKFVVSRLAFADSLKFIDHYESFMRT